MILAVQPLGRKMRILADRFIYPYLATSQTDPPPLIRPYAAGFRIRMKNTLCIQSHSCGVAPEFDHPRTRSSKPSRLLCVPLTPREKTGRPVPARTYMPTCVDAKLDV